MTINANTKIATILKQHPEALEAIVSLSPKFVKLRNPMLRKVIAGRTSLTMASKLGGCKIEDFYTALKPLGFEPDEKTPVAPTEETIKPEPAFMKLVEPGKFVHLDVRAEIESGNDPFQLIMQQVKTLPPGHVLNIINSFEPTPLIHMLAKKGFEAYAKVINDEQVNTYFYKKEEAPGVEPDKNNYADGWDEVLARYEGSLEKIDVRDLPMPLPMHAILDALETLPDDKALYVSHKRIPVFLLPELEARNFHFRIKEISEGEVYLLIYKN